ncbi:MAG: Na+/H+ antiporter subunit D [Actinobacteria bacterium]|nr:Na+/H+ antiporter subunit D [Actinomycetota bacterium]
MNHLVVLPVVVPLFAAAFSMLFGRWRSVQRALGLVALVTTTIVSIVVLVEVDRNGIVVLDAGGWMAPLGISLVVDRLSAIMLVVASMMLLVVLVFAIGQPGAERHHVGFQSVYLILAAGVAGAFVTGDLFNLFVSFEMMLTASYVLLTLGGRREQVRSGMTYVVISLLASALFITALALLYAATGTVNMADLSVRIAELPHGVRQAFAALLVVVFGIKAAIFPLFSWLPDSYPLAPSPVTAVFAGLLTKVGVYALIRSQTLLFPDDSRASTLLLVAAGLTMVIGILGAIAQDDVKRILSFNIVSHIGFMVMGLGLFSVAGVAAAIFYAVHHIVAMTTLFLVGGLIEHAGGSSRMSELGDMVRSVPVVAFLYLVPAIGLAGIPPLSGFVPKFGLIEAGFAEHQYVIVAASLVASLLTLFSVVKIWIGVFWSPAYEVPTGRVRPVGRLGGPPLMVLPTVVLLGVGLAIAVLAGPLYGLCDRAADDLLHPARYLEAVLGR